MPTPLTRQLAAAALLLALLLALLPGLARAETVPLCAGDFPPYNSISLPRHGPVLAIVSEALRRQGDQAHVEFLPWARLLKKAEAGECAIVGLWRSAEREQQFHFSTPIVRQELGFFGLKSRPVGELQKQLIGVERGSYLSPALLEPGIHLHPMQGVRGNFAMLSRQRVDLAFTDRAAGEFLLAAQPELAAVIEWKGLRLEFKDAHLAAALSFPRTMAWVERFDKGLASMKADGSYPRILRQAKMVAPTP